MDRNDKIQIIAALFLGTPGNFFDTPTQALQAADAMLKAIENAQGKE